MTCILLRKCIPLSKLEKWSADVDSPIFFTRRSPIYRMHDILSSCVVLPSDLMYINPTFRKVGLELYLVAHPTARKWVITPVISGLTLLIPFITGVITHLRFVG